MSKRGTVRWAGRGFVALGGALALVAATFWLTLPTVSGLRRHAPATTALMEARAAEALKRHRPARRTQHWTPLSRISPWLQRAVVNSEDARFWEHDGVDVVQTQLVVEKAIEKGRLGRGASTITQQLAKNLWLGEERSLWRKSREWVLAKRLETLGKERVLELYLNVVEWGEGIYGADAAARVWFGKSAAGLLPEEAAILAAMLPAPRRRNPHKPSAHLRKRAFEVLELYGIYNQLAPEDLAAARQRLRSILGAA